MGVITDGERGTASTRAALGDGLPDRDDAAAIWERYLPKDRILRFGEAENFWAMGETGPCGPCSEVHYYQGDDPAGNTPDRVNGPGDETVEIWNLVFMQFERDASGKLDPLPRPSVDTGAGLERLTAVLQGVSNNYDTDLFAPILSAISEIVIERGGAPFRGNFAPEDAPYRVIADHERAATMLIADGCSSNEGRGYVLRESCAGRCGTGGAWASRTRFSIDCPGRGRHLRGESTSRQRTRNLSRSASRKPPPGGGALRQDSVGGHRPGGRGCQRALERGEARLARRDRLPVLRHARNPDRGDEEIAGTRE